MRLTWLRRLLAPRAFVPSDELTTLYFYWLGLGPAARAILLRHARRLHIGARQYGDFTVPKDYLAEALDEVTDAVIYLEQRIQELTGGKGCERPKGK